MDLYQLKLHVAALGGFDAVARGKKWADVTQRLGYEEKDAAQFAAQIKRAYTKVIYPFEHFLSVNRETTKKAGSTSNGTDSAQDPHDAERAASFERTSVEPKGAREDEMLVDPPPWGEDEAMDEATEAADTGASTLR